MPKLDTRARCLDITTAKICSVDCRYWCPQVKFREVYGEEPILLTLDDFKLALSKTPKDINIVFAGFSEPFMNRWALDMIELAKAEGYKVSLYSTLVGLMAEDVPRLKVLDYFCLHEPDNKGIAHIPDTPNYQKTLSAVFHTLDIDERSRMDRQFYGEDRAGNSEAKVKLRNVRGPFYCHKLIAPQPIMLPNLDLQLCSMDWTLRHTLGSLRTQTYKEVVDGELFRAISRAKWHMEGSELCRSCSNAWSLPKAVAIEVGWAGYKKVYEWTRKSMQV